MFKSMTIGAAMVLAVAAPAMAGSGGCDDKEMWTKTETQINAMPAGAEKDAALSDWKMSADFKAANNMNECDSHLKSANDHLSKGLKG